VRKQVEAALELEEANPPRPNHFARTVARSYLCGALVAPDAMATAEGRVVEGDPVLGNLLAAAEEAANG